MSQPYESGTPRGGNGPGGGTFPAGPATAAPKARTSRLFVILNPAAGTYSAREVREALGRHFDRGDGSCEIYETTGREDLTEVARAAAERGFEVVVAGGGDGSVSAVANGLVGTSAALGIIPLGTANVLARELGIPVDPDGACALLSGPNSIARIDAIEAGHRHNYTQVGIGIDALMIRDTRREAKRRFGRLAYLWTGFTRLLGFQPRRFLTVVDGRSRRTRALEVVLANCGTMGQPPFRWGPNIRPDDGRISVCIIRARNLIDYLVLAWQVILNRHRSSRHVTFLVAERTIAVAVDKPLPVQADGEIIGETPVDARVIPSDMAVVVPAEGIPHPPA
jgi:diacylglycerol kinase (ATP)